MAHGPWQDESHRRFEVLDQKVDRDFRWIVGILLTVMTAVMGVPASGPLYNPSRMVDIPHSVTIVGEVSGDGDLVVHGRVTGTIEAPDGLLTIGPDARINGDVRAREVEVYGRVQATIVASQRIELAFSASVRGNLSADHVVLSDGARFSGRIDMNRRTVAHTVERFRRLQREGPAGRPTVPGGSGRDGGRV